MSLAHVYGQSVENVWTERRWDVVETGEGSNTAITAQLISIGVTERISVTPSMFTQPGRESSSNKEEERRGRKSDSFFQSIHSSSHYVHLISFMCLFMYSFIQVAVRDLERIIVSLKYLDWNIFNQNIWMHLSLQPGKLCSNEPKTSDENVGPNMSFRFI